MRPGYDPYEETQKPTPDGKFFERAALSLGVGFLIFAIALAAYLFGCTAHGQEAPTMLIPEVLYDAPTNQVERTLLKRPAQQMVPPLPPVISRTVATNVTPDGRWRRVTVTEHEIMPPPLIQDKPKTNAFFASCPECKVRAIRKPIRIEVVGSKSVPGGDELERWIWFKCCDQEFRRKNWKFVEEEIAQEVTVPVK